MAAVKTLAHSRLIYPYQMAQYIRASKKGSLMFRILPLAAAVFFATTLPGQAGFQSWSVDKESDPFSGGESVSVNFMTTFRSGVLVLCDSATKGVRVRAIPGFVYDERLKDFKPTLKFAFDGKLLFTAEGDTGSVGDNLAASEVTLEGDQAKQFVDAFASAKKQIAIDDGIADKPHLLTAKGSTTSGAAIVSCVAKQGSSS